MTADYAWLSWAMGHASNMRPLRPDIAQRDPERFEEGRHKIKNGQPIRPDELPQVIYGVASAGPDGYELPDLFHAYGYWVISAGAADVLQHFDLGGGGLFPVRVVEADKQTPVAGEWLCINFGNRKSAFLPDQSKNAWHDYIRDGQKGWFAPPTIKDGDFALSAAALEGPDIWIDPDVGDAVFLSGALGAALKKAKADKGWFLTKCRVVEA